MRELSATRPATLRDPHDNLPESGNPPRLARQLSRISTTTLRPRQPSATRTPTLRDLHDNAPPTAAPRAPPGNSPWPARRWACARAGHVAAGAGVSDGAGGDWAGRAWVS